MIQRPGTRGGSWGGKRGGHGQAISKAAYSPSVECIWHLVKGHQLANFWGPRNSPDLGYGAPAIRCTIIWLDATSLGHQRCVIALGKVESNWPETYMAAAHFGLTLSDRALWESKRAMSPHARSTTSPEASWTDFSHLEEASHDRLGDGASRGRSSVDALVCLSLKALERA